MTDSLGVILSGVGLTIAAIGLVLGVLNTTRLVREMTKVGSRLEDHFDNNLNKSLEATLETIRANGEETRKTIAAVHESIKKEIG